MCIRDRLNTCQNCIFQLVFQDRSHNKDRAAKTSLAQVLSFLYRGHSESRCTFIQRCSCNPHGSMTITVCLHHRHVTGARTEPAQDSPVSYTHLRAHETVLDLVCRLLLEKKKKH